MKFVARLDVNVDCEYAYLSRVGRWRCVLGGHYRICDFDKRRRQELRDMCDMSAKPVGWQGK